MRIRTPHTLVYWEPNKADKFGFARVLDPVELKCRWEDKKAEAGINPDGMTIFASSVIYLQTPLEVGGYVMQGTIEDVEDSGFPDDPTMDSRVREIIRVDNIPDLRGKSRVVTVMIQ